MAVKSVYIASRYSRKEEMRITAQRLMAAGYHITSSWLSESYDPNIKIDTLTDDVNRRIALVDLKDITDADIFVFFAEDQDKQPPRGGRHVEFGYALSHGLEMYVVGAKENIFHYLPTVTVVKDVEEFIRVRG